MLKAGYSEETSKNPKQKLVDTAGFQVLIEKHREELRSVGISSLLLAELKKIGLFDPDADIRLKYIKEVAKDLGIAQPDNKGNNVFVGIGFNKKDYEG